MKVILYLAAAISISCAAATVAQDQRPNRAKRSALPDDRGALQIADLAPNFVLNSLDGASETDLQSFRDQKPVVLIFGSYT